MHKCRQHGRRVCLWCLITTVAFPVEHLVWTRAPILRHIAQAMGL